MNNNLPLLLALSEKATAGPFTVEDADGDGSVYFVCVQHPEVGAVSVAETRNGCDEAAGMGGNPEANAEFIAALVNWFRAEGKDLAELVHYWQARHADLLKFATKTGEELEALRASNARGDDGKYAARYRWLRNEAHPDRDDCGLACAEMVMGEWGKWNTHYFAGDELDAKIDAMLEPGSEVQT